MTAEPPASLAISDAALAAHDFWRASLGAREALDRGHTALAAMQIRHLAEGIAAWPAKIQARARERVGTLYPALHTALALEAPL